MHCENAPCAAICESNAYDRRPDGLLLLNPEKCSGCGRCASACPYGVIYFNEGLNISQKCTGCAHLLDDGHDAPHCVDVCPHEALWYGEETEYDGDLDQTESLYGHDELGSRVYYLNLPKRFIGGMVIDSEQEEVLIGATITLENCESEEVLVTQSDEFGDFWFKQIEATHYKLYVEYEGYMTRVLEVDVSVKDKNVGEIDLYLTPSS